MTHAEKLAAAIAWLRERRIYALEIPLGVNRYKPVHGFPLEPKK